MRSTEDYTSFRQPRLSTARSMLTEMRAVWQAHVPHDVVGRYAWPLVMQSNRESLAPRTWPSGVTASSPCGSTVRGCGGPVGGAGAFQSVLPPGTVDGLT